MDHPQHLIAVTMFKGFWSRGFYRPEVLPANHPKPQSTEGTSN